MTSLRKLEWGSMRANFFVIINPRAMATRRADLHDGVPPAAATARRWAMRWRASIPNLTVIDVSGIIRQVQEVVDQVVTAVEFLFMFTLASGVLVLYAALMGSQDERTPRSGPAARAGRDPQAAVAGAVDRVFAGGRPGRPAGGDRRGGAGLGAGDLPVQVPWTFSPKVWLAGVVVGALCAIIGGWLGLRNVLRQPPLQTLREA